MKTPEWLKFLFGDDMDVKEIVMAVAAVLIIVSFLNGL